MNNNSLISKEDRRSDAIASLLSGRSDEIKVSVLEYVVKYNIDPENEFFIIFVALGVLETLIKNSPQQWQELFKNFQTELGEWTQTNLETLNLLSQKARVTEKLAQNSEKLSNSLIQFLSVCEGLISQLQMSNGALSNSLLQLQTSEIELKSLVNSLGKELNQLKIDIKQSRDNPNRNQISNASKVKKSSIWKDKIMIILGAFSISLLMMNLGFIFKQYNLELKTSQKVQWLLEKANRQDCLAGIKTPDSPECR